MFLFRKKSLFIILLGLILLTILIGYSLSKRDQLSMPEKFVTDSLGYGQVIINKPLSLISGFVSNIKDIKTTYDENIILREKLSEFKTIVHESQELKQENKELREIVDIVDSARDYDPIVSEVIARSPERYMDQITINRGSRHGVKKDMPVTSKDGMIGKVISTSPSTAKVQLVSGFDQLNKISATVVTKKGKKIFGLIEGYDQDKNMLIFSMLDQDKGVKLQEDEEVYSSNLGGLFPDGLLIGKVKEVNPNKYGLTTTAYIEPAANLYDLKQVIVIDRNLESEDGEDDSK